MADTNSFEAELPTNGGTKIYYVQITLPNGMVSERVRAFLDLSEAATWVGNYCYVNDDRNPPRPVPRLAWEISSYVVPPEIEP